MARRQMHLVAGASLAALQGNLGMQGTKDLLDQVMQAEKLGFKETAVQRICRGVVPELQRRGLFRRECSGSTLRENLRG